jgi:NAD(P)H-hydrate repair Nnr-like enzyme with NAD(P)H-hydrate epimerase domain
MARGEVARVSTGIEDEGMIRGYTAQQVRDAEKPHLAAGEPLMLRAAHALALRIRGLLDERGNATPRVLLLVGSGDNGGDALFAGAELARAGVSVTVLSVGSRMHEAGRAAAVAGGAAFAAVDTTPDPGDFGVIVDGILGTGTSAASPALRGRAREVVLAVLAGLGARLEEEPESSSSSGSGSGSGSGSERPAVVAVDIPSGIDPDSGAAPDAAVLPADVTVTFGGIKAGLLRGDGARLAGRVELVEIGIEADLAAMSPAVELP